MNNSQGTRWKQRFNNYIKYLKYLQELIAISTERDLPVIERMALIKLFEMTNEPAVNMLKDYLEELGTIKCFPKEIIREALARELLTDGQVWIDMLEGRNKAAHTYDEAQAKALAQDISVQVSSCF